MSKKKKKLDFLKISDEKLFSNLKQKGLSKVFLSNPRRKYLNKAFYLFLKITNTNQITTKTKSPVLYKYLMCKLTTNIYISFACCCFAKDGDDGIEYQLI